MAGLTVRCASSSVATPGNQSITVTGLSNRVIHIEVRYNNIVLFHGNTSTAGVITVPVSKSWFDTAGVTNAAYFHATVYADAAGYTGTGSFDVVAGSDTNPVVGTPTATPVNTGNAATYFPNTFIAGVSKLKVAVAVTRPTNAQLSSVTVNVQGVGTMSLSYNSGTGKWEGTTGTVLTASTQYMVTATDQRGRTGKSAWINVTVNPYTKPVATIDESGTYRCTVLGDEADDGTRYKAQATATYASLSGNGLISLTVQQQTGELNPNNLTSGVQSGVLGNMNQGMSYTLVFTVSDKVSSAQYFYELKAPTREIVINHSSDGTNVGVGGIPTVTSGYSTVELPATGKFMIGGVDIGQMTELCDTGTLTYNSLSSFACAWKTRAMLFINLCFWSNHLATVVVPQNYFNSTTSTARIIISGQYDASNSPVVVDVYKADDTHIYCKLITNTQNIRIKVYGLYATA